MSTAIGGAFHDRSTFFQISHHNIFYFIETWLMGFLEHGSRKWHRQTRSVNGFWDIASGNFARSGCRAIVGGFYLQIYQISCDKNHTNVTTISLTVFWGVSNFKIVNLGIFYDVTYFFVSLPRIHQKLQIFCLKTDGSYFPCYIEEIRKVISL